MKPYFVKTPKVIDRVYPHFLWRINSKEKQLFLTFDDGPTPEITPWVIAQLEKYGAKATFFCVGSRLEQHPDIVEQLLAEGHQLANHTYAHEHGRRTDTESYLRSVRETQKILVGYGVKKKLFRPPYGRITAKQAKTLRKLGYTVVMWTVLSADFDQKISKDKCYKNVVNNTVSGSIIVFHDSKKAFGLLKYTLPKVLAHYQKAGYSFYGL